MSSADLIAAALTSPPEVAESLYALAHGESIRETIRACTLCPLHESSTQRVPFEGSPSPVALIGEAPGASEDLIGSPFQGRAGVLLTQTLEAVGIARSSVGILNTICCRPPQNNYSIAIESGAVSACSRHFYAQLGYLGSWVLVLMGNSALQAFCPGESIGKARLRPRWVESYYVIPTYHPAYALRSPDARTLIAKDLSRIPPILAGDREVPFPKGYDPMAPIEFLRRQFNAPLTAVVEDALLPDTRLKVHVGGGDMDRTRVHKLWRRHGYVVVYTPLFNDTIVVWRSEGTYIEPKYAHLPRYTPEEIARLRHLRSQSQLRRVHLLKRELGVEVVS